MVSLELSHQSSEASAKREEAKRRWFDYTLDVVEREAGDLSSMLGRWSRRHSAYGMSMLLIYSVVIE